MSERQRYESDAIRLSYASGSTSGSNSFSRAQERIECLPDAGEGSLLRDGSLKDI